MIECLPVASLFTLNEASALTQLMIRHLREKEKGVMGVTGRFASVLDFLDINPREFQTNPFCGADLP
jgi:hypothetical protein